MTRLTVADERWPIAGAFTIARGAKTEAHVIVARVEADGVVGRGEGTPYARYGETVEDALRALRDLDGRVLDRAALPSLMPPGAARNALDCALWDLEAKREGVRAWTLAGCERLRPVTTCYTISLDAPEVMAEHARERAGWPVLKVKIGGPGDIDAVAAVRRAAPRARLIVDANESLRIGDLRRLGPAFARLGVSLIEQPLPAGDDAELEGYASPTPLCADESLHTRAELAACARRYKVANLKLDKTGGLTEALALKAEAQALGLEVMVGCMVATSLAMAPALLLAQGAAYVDLDGPLLLARDRSPGLTFRGAEIEPPPPALWG